MNESIEEIGKSTSSIQEIFRSRNILKDREVFYFLIRKYHSRMLEIDKRWTHRDTARELRVGNGRVSEAYTGKWRKD